jgi:hypothetical protein
MPIIHISGRNALFIFGGNKMERETLISKIQKLMAKATNQATTPEESAIFMKKIEELKLQHNLEDCELNTKQDEVFTDEDSLDDTTRTWKQSLGNLISKTNGCYVYKSSSSGRMVITGTKQDIAVTRLMYSYCVNEIERLTKKLAYGKGKRFVNSFKMGAVSGIGNAIAAEKQRQRAAYASNERALAVVNEGLVKLKNAEAYVRKNVSIRSSSRRSSVDYSGFSSGSQAGSSIYGNFGNNRISY